MQVELTPAQEDAARRARAPSRDELIPLEVEAELAGGRLAGETADASRARARSSALVGGNHPREHGGLGWTIVEQVVVHEELGRSTNASGGPSRRLQRALRSARRSRSTRYLAPRLRGERSDAYAVTEARGRLRPGGIAGTAGACRTGFRIGPRSGS